MIFWLFARVVDCIRVFMLVVWTFGVLANTEIDSS